MLRSIHFGRTPATVQNKLEQGYKCIFDTDAQKIRFKRPMENKETADEEVAEQNVAEEKEVDEKKVLSGKDISCEEDGERKKNEEIFHAAINVVKESGRDQDFLAVLEGLASGALNPHNIAVQLFLDIGAFLSAETVNNVRYSSLTLNFWTLVKKLFHGKATNFFRGYMTGINSGKSGNKILVLI